MPVSEKQQKSVNKYVKEKYDRINLTVEKGERAKIAEHAEQRGEKVNAFIKRAISNQKRLDIEANLGFITVHLGKYEIDEFILHAKAQGEQIEEFIIRAMLEQYDRDKGIE